MYVIVPVRAISLNRNLRAWDSNLSYHIMKIPFVNIIAKHCMYTMLGNDVNKMYIYDMIE